MGRCDPVIWLVGFWASASVVAYVLAAFPLLLVVRGRLHRRPLMAVPSPLPPRVTVLIAARNEVGCIRAKVERLLELDHPPTRMQVIVASDGSTDGTDEAVRAIGDARVTVLSLPAAGKAAALNAALPHASGEIIVFTDANSWFADHALRALLAPFGDPTVGGVAGDQRYVRAGDEDGIADGERAYWSLERIVKNAEGSAGSTISATGAIYAIRRELVEPVPPDVTDDFFISTGVIAAGRRLVFAPEAVAYEPVAASGGLEYERKVRVMTRGLIGVHRRAALLDPRRSGFYAVQLLTHKVLRRLLGLPLAMVIGCAVPLRSRHPLYRAVAVGGFGFLASGAAGVAARGRPAARIPLLSLPAYACMCGVAAARAAWNVATGRRITSWEPSGR